MKKILRIKKYIFILCIMIYLAVYLTIEQLKIYENNNQILVDTYISELEKIEVSLANMAYMSQYFLENSFVKVKDKKGYVLEQSDDGSYNTNNIANYEPKELTGNYYGIKDATSNVGDIRKFLLISYLDSTIYKTYDEHKYNTSGYLSNVAVNTINLFINDLYIYKFPFKKFEKSDNPYQQKMNEYGIRYLSDIRKSENIAIKGLYKNINGEYVFTISYPIKYFDDLVGFISLDFNANALTNYTNINMETLVFTESNGFILSNSEQLLRANSTKELEMFLESDILNRCRNLIQKQDKKIYFMLDRIFFLNRVEEYDIVIINSIQTIKLIQVLLPILVLIVLVAKIISSLRYHKKVRKNILKTVYELEDKNKKLEVSLKEDYLTNILTKIVINDELEKEIENFKKEDNLYICICDIDNIKKINSKYGYYVGDMALKHVTTIVKENIRKVDKIAMWNSPKFLIITKDLELSDAISMFENIKYTIENTPFTIGENIFNITVSFGIAKYKSNLLKNKLLANAESALLTAKNKGKNMVVMYKDG